MVSIGKNTIRNTGRLLLFVSGICAVAILTEGYLLFTGYRTRPTVWFFSNKEYNKERIIYATHPLEIYEYKKNISIVPDYWETDEHGFRKNSQHQSETTKDTILVIGDSFAYGHGVRHEEAWPYLLEQKLQITIPTLYVHNAAVAATGTDQQYIRLHRFVKEFHPTAVIWMISTNDMMDSNDACLFSKVPDGTYKQIPGFFNIAYINGLLLERFPSWFIKTRIGNLLTSTTFDGKDLATYGCTQRIDKQDLPTIYFPKLKYLLSNTKKMLASQDINFLVLLAPVQWYFDQDSKNTNYEIILEHYFRQALYDTGVAFIDLNPEITQVLSPSLFVLRETQSDENLAVAGVASDNLSYQLFNEEKEVSFGSWHLNTRGNEVVSNIVYDALVRYGF